MYSTKTEHILDNRPGEANAIRQTQPAQDHQECFATAQVWTCNQRECRSRRSCLHELAEAVAADP